MLSAKIYFIGLLITNQVINSTPAWVSQDTPVFGKELKAITEVSPLLSIDSKADLKDTLITNKEERVYYNY